MQYFLFVLIAVLVHRSAQVELSSKSLEGSEIKDEIESGDYIVLYYTPGCEWSDRFALSYNLLVERLALKTDSKLKVGHVDCTANKDFCTEQKVTDTPTVVIYKNDPKSTVAFNVKRNYKELAVFLNSVIGEDVFPVGEVDLDNELKKKVPLNDLTEDNFKDHVSEGLHFVKFFAPWCGHCKNLAPTWEDLANSLEYDNAISIAKVDCTQHRSVCQDFDVKGYPTLLWIENGKKIDKYSGARTLEQLKKYVDKMSGQEETAPAAGDDGEQSAILILTGGNFEHAIEKGVTFVKFYAPWCGHCKRLAPTWEELALKFRDSGEVKIAKVDCTSPESKELCTSEGVHGFPTMYLYRNGERQDEFDGSRSLESLVDYVKKEAVVLKKHEEL